MNARVPRRLCRAFSLVELLCCIGIIALLAGLLFPTLASARATAQRTQCLSNLRQIGLAFTMYLGENGGRFPRPAQKNIPLPEDWIHFQPDRDPNEGAIARYVGKPFKPDIYRCPSDDVKSHKSYNDFGGNPVRYEYSYAVNERICRIRSTGPTLRIGQVRNPAQKILVIDESAATIDDGCWAWQPDQGSGWNVLAIRHDERRERPDEYDHGRGNAAFVDGHAEYIQRGDSFDPRWYDPEVR